MKKKWKVLTFIGFLTALYAGYMWGIPAVVNIKSHKSFIESKIYDNSGYIVDIGSPKLSMGIFPSVWISSDNVSILNKDNSKALSVDNPKLKIKLLPLIFKKIEISQVSTSREDVF